MQKHKLLKTVLKLLVVVMYGMLIFATFFFVLSGCSTPKPIETTIFKTKTDTVKVVKERKVIDTLFLGAEYGDTDTIICPPGLTRDSLIYLYDYVYLPGRKVPYKVFVHDTIKEITTVQSVNSGLLNTGSNWRERLTWLGLVFTLVIGWLKPFKKKEKEVQNAD